MDSQLDIRDKDEMFKAFDYADIILNKKYLANMTNCNIVPISKDLEGIKLNEIARFYKIEQFVYDKNENNRDKLISVFQVMSALNFSLFILVDGKENEIDYYIGARGENSNIGDMIEALAKSFSGNFPGTTFKNSNKGLLLNKEVEALSKNIFYHNESTNSSYKSIASITGIAGLRKNKEHEQEKFVQGLEKVIDAMHGERYSLLLIADPIHNEEIQNIQRSYENLYTSLKPFEITDLTFSQNESENLTNSLSKGVTESVNESITNTITKTKGTSNSISHSDSKTKGWNISGGGIGAAIGGAIGALGGPPGVLVGMGLGTFIGSSVSRNTSKTEGNTTTSGTNESNSDSRGKTIGSNYGTTKTESIGKTSGSGSSQSILIKSENKAIKNLLEKIDLQTKRLNEGQSIGMWNFSAYCIADNDITAKIGAAEYQSVIRGENTYLEAGSITLWKGENLDEVKKYLSKMMHPVIELNNNQIPIASLVNTKELTIHSILPEKSVAGLAVKSLASFGREVILQEKNKGNSLALGSVYHMGKEEDSKVLLDKNNLTAHTFITGATGSGKSNTVYQILNEAREKRVKFLVVEPAKGEYKHILGNDDNVSVYGTNPKLTPMLRINPFSFPKEIHILEHLDRLVELFNVCWPMYAAMPAVLKEAIEKSYIDAGWDLESSTNTINEKILPTFSDVMNNIKVIINASEYSEENKGNYKGALVTRLKSLTNGINGMIFVNDELSNNDLFDKNVIVDLSRVGSTETKSLIMGLLVMKLHEFRMTQGKLNANLNHITVLEEAHNLLKRTSTDQSSEGSNLLGKSVEMLSNSIAEMRTYGEGFIIADQSPELLDMAVIRNTNTKIIMRTPDFSDRELVGKAAGLNDEQIIEIGKLPRGVAAVYQNNWIEPVLCKVNHYKNDSNNKKYENKEQFTYSKKEYNNLIINLSKYLLSDILDEKIDINIDELKDKLIHSSINVEGKKDILNFLENNYLPKDLNEIYHIISLLHTNSVEVADKAIEKSSNPEEWNSIIASEVKPQLFNYEANYQAVILQCIVYELSKQDKVYEELPLQWTEFMNKGRAL